MALRNLNIFLLVIFAIAFLLRFWQLGSNPMSLNWDEVAWGYNSYSIGIDGREEFGNFLPYKYLESFGDFKPPVYAYLGIVPVKLFGLNEFATRFPSALIGLLTVLVTYFLVKEIFPKNKNKEKIALFSAFLLAISPWHIFLSRAAFEANVSSFFIITGIFAFLKGINGKRWFLPISALFLALSFYTFNTARVFVPLLGIILVAVFRKQLLSNIKPTITAGVLTLLLILPIATFLVSPQATLRFKEVNIFTDTEVIERSNQYVENNDNALWSKVLHNRRVLYGIEFVKHYLDNLNPSFLFIKGDGNPKFATQDVGQLLIWEMPFLIIGAFILFRKKEGHYWLIPIWIILGIIPAATARETPHALRIETVLPTFQIVTAVGFIYAWNYIKRISSRNLGYLVRSAVLLALVINIAYFAHSYFIHYPRESAQDWNYGYKEAFEYLKNNEDKYDKVFFTKDYGRPHMYHLFYNQIDPKYYRENSDIRRDVFGFVHVDRIGKYHFIDDVDPPPGGKSIYVRTWDNVPGQANVVAEFNLPNGKPSLKAYVKD